MKKPRTIVQMVVRETATDLYTDGPAQGCRTPEDAEQIARAAIEAEPLTAGQDKEGFWTIHLNVKNGVKSVELVTLGLLDSSLVHAREVFRGAIVANAAAVVLFHNHPTGDPTPSAEDIRITRKLVEAGKVIDIKVMDHIIIGRKGAPVMSIRENGLVDFS